MYSRMVSSTIILLFISSLAMSSEACSWVREPHAKLETSRHGGRDDRIALVSALCYFK